MIEIDDVIRETRKALDVAIATYGDARLDGGRRNNDALISESLVRLRGEVDAEILAAVEAERRAIVMWLRSQAESNVPVQSGIERRMLALAIDSGEHLK